MRRAVLVACLTGGLLAGVPTESAHAKSYTWVADNCFDDHHAISIWKRVDARAYAYVAAGEGYDYGGGCWNDNDRDDTPPVAGDDPGSEGPDCSGLAFKSWFLRSPYGTSGGTWYNKFEDVHGPYSSTAFHDDGSGVPFFQLASKSRSTTLYMDAFAKQGHIGLIYSDVPTNNNLDWILEAKGNFYGTAVFTEDYRFDSDYVAVRRKGWTQDCYPNCTAVARPPVVVVP